MVIDYPGLSDHSPILLTVSCEVEEAVKTRTKRIRVGRMTDEMWAEREVAAGARLGELLPEDFLSRPAANAETLHGVMARATREVFREGSGATTPQKETDPFSHFLLMRIRYPEKDALLAALEWGDEQRSERYMCRVSADGWRTNLKGVNKGDARAFFAYLARSEG